jgi:hypothetical protein
MTTVQVQLPDDLAAAAQKQGLLSADKLEVLLRRELRLQKAEPLFSAMEKLHSAKIQPMSAEQVQTEVKAVRTTKRGRRTGGS